MWPAIIAGAAMLGSALIGREGQREANAASSDQAERMMGFQERMSTSAHQREVGDLRAAGLNPILSVNAGSSTPAGAQAQMQNPNSGFGQSAMDMVRATIDGKRLANETKMANAQAEKAKMETKVLQKDENKAEIINDMFGIVKPWVEKLKDAEENAAKQSKEWEKMKGTKGTPLKSQPKTKFKTLY